MIATEHRTRPSLRMPAGNGRLLQIGGLGALERVAPRGAPGRLAIIEHTLAAGALGAPPHRHAREEEVTYVLGGQLTIEVGTDVLVAEAGDLIVKPRGVFHAFWNAGTATAHFLELIVPGALASFFSELAAQAGPETAPESSALVRLGARYGVEYRMERIPELCARHGVRW